MGAKMTQNCGTELIGLSAVLLLEDAHVPAAVQRQIRLRSYDATALLRNNVWRWDTERKWWVPLQ